VEDLRKRGVLLGERRPPDRRRQFWTLTAKGESILSRLAEALDAAIRGNTAIESASAGFSTAASQLDTALEIIALASEPAAVSTPQKSSQKTVADRAA
jgi:DNA-binding MarR family transcriptional regulator